MGGCRCVASAEVVVFVVLDWFDADVAAVAGEGIWLVVAAGTIEVAEVDALISGCAAIKLLSEVLAAVSGRKVV